MLIIDWNTYTFIELHFVLKYVDHDFRKLEEKAGEYKELSIVSIDEKCKSEENLSDSFV